MLHLVGLAYASATDASNIKEVLRHFSEHIGARCAQIVTRRLSTGAVLDSQSSGDLCQEANREYVRRWGELDPRAEMLACLPAGQVLRCHEHFDAAFVSANRFFQGYLIPHGLRWSLAGLYRNGPDLTTAIMAARGPDAAPFEDWAAETLRQLLPHLERAAAIRAQIEQQAVAVKSATDMLKMLPTPCLFADPKGRCVQGNGAFSHSLDEFSAHLVTGRMRFNQPEVQSRWEAALLETHATALGRTMTLTSPGGKEWKLHFMPWQPLVAAPDTSDKRVVLVLFEERAAEVQVHSDAAAATARLTRAEMEVLASLLKGLPAKAIASRRSASVHTVRSQIMAILDKTGFNSQRELIASFGASTLPPSVFGNSTFQ